MRISCFDCEWTLVLFDELLRGDRAHVRDLAHLQGRSEPPVSRCISLFYERLQTRPRSGIFCARIHAGIVRPQLKTEIEK
jgi:hypothetical protein